MGREKANFELKFMPSSDTAESVSAAALRNFIG